MTGKTLQSQTQTGRPRRDRYRNRISGRTDHVEPIPAFAGNGPRPERH